MQRRRALFGMVALCSLLGCSEGSDTGDVESAAEGWRAANTAIAGGQAEFTAEIEDGEEGDISVSCPDGGELGLEGAQDNPSEFEFNIFFDSCMSDGVTVDGELALSGTVETTDTSVEVRFDYTGELEFTGRVEQVCAIDAVGRTKVTADGNMASAEVEFSGRICGADASAVVKATS